MSPTVGPRASGAGLKASEVLEASITSSESVRSSESSLKVVFSGSQAASAGLAFSVGITDSQNSLSRRLVDVVLNPFQSDPTSLSGRLSGIVNEIQSEAIRLYQQSITTPRSEDAREDATSETIPYQILNSALSSVGSSSIPAEALPDAMDAFLEFDNDWELGVGGSADLVAERDASSPYDWINNTWP